MTISTSKDVLIILSNEAFLPRTGSGRFSSELSNWTTIHEAPMHRRPHSRKSEEEEEEEDSESVSPSAEEFHREHRPTGVDALELVTMWVAFHQCLKCRVTLASPRGGPVAMDPQSHQMLENEEKLRSKIKNDNDFWRKVTHTVPLHWINPQQYDIVLIPGSYAALYDLVEDKMVSRTLAEIYANDGYVAAIGHGVASMMNVRNKPRSKKTSERKDHSSSSSSDYLLTSRRVCCPTKEEEEKNSIEEFLPYFLEDKLKNRKCKLENKKAFQSNVVTDERIITAQNTASTKQFIEVIAECLGFKNENIKEICS